MPRPFITPLSEALDGVKDGEIEKEVRSLFDEQLSLKVLTLTEALTDYIKKSGKQ